MIIRVKILNISSAKIKESKKKISKCSFSTLLFLILQYCYYTTLKCALQDIRWELRGWNVTKLDLKAVAVSPSSLKEAACQLLFPL